MGPELTPMGCAVHSQRRYGAWSGTAHHVSTPVVWHEPSVLGYTRGTKEPAGEDGFRDRNFGALFTCPAVANTTYMGRAYTSCHANEKRRSTGLIVKHVTNQSDEWVTGGKKIRN